MPHGSKSDIQIKLALPLGVKIVLILLTFVSVFILWVGYIIKSISNNQAIFKEYSYLLLFPLGIYFAALIMYNSQSRQFIKQFLIHFKASRK